MKTDVEALGESHNDSTRVDVFVCSERVQEAGDSSGVESDGLASGTTTDAKERGGRAKRSFQKLRAEETREWGTDGGVICLSYIRRVVFHATVECVAMALVRRSAL